MIIRFKKLWVNQFSNEQNVVLLKLRKLWWLRKSDYLDCNGVIKFSILLSAVEVFGRYYRGHYLPQIFNETRDRLISSWEHSTEQRIRKQSSCRDQAAEGEKNTKHSSRQKNIVEMSEWWHCLISLLISY